MWILHPQNVPLTRLISMMDVLIHAKQDINQSVEVKTGNVKLMELGQEQSLFVKVILFVCRSPNCMRITHQVIRVKGRVYRVSQKSSSV